MSNTLSQLGFGSNNASVEEVEDDAIASEDEDDAESTEVNPVFHFESGTEVYVVIKKTPGCGYTALVERNGAMITVSASWEPTEDFLNQVAAVLEIKTSFIAHHFPPQIWSTEISPSSPVETGWKQLNVKNDKELAVLVFRMKSDKPIGF